eukprot:m.227923 g.227923  ORF g.227923 m.227923 type:complete len:800 (-) comp15974_c0_seq31:1845-4244(-)
MGQYKSRPSNSTSVQDAWREECERAFKFIDNTLRARQHPPKDISQWPASHRVLLKELKASADNDWDASLVENEGMFHKFQEYLRLDASEAEKPGFQRIRPLHLCAAATTDDIACEHAVNLLASGANPWVLCEKGFLPVHVAAYVGFPKLTMMLCLKGDQELGASVSNCYPNGIAAVDNAFQRVTPLHVACRHGHIEVVKALLDYNADINTSDDLGFTALHFAILANSCNPDLVQLLIDNGANVDASTLGGDKPIHIAAYKNNHEVAKIILDTDVAQATQVDKEMNTPLHYFCRSENSEAVRLISSLGGQDALLAQNMYRDTPLHWACYNGAAEIISLSIDENLVDMAQAVRYENAFGETLLHAAATFGKSPLLLNLLLHQPGASVNVQGEDGHTPLHSACFHGHKATVQHLIEADADVRIRTNEKETCAMWCHQQGYDELVSIIQQTAQQYVQTPELEGTASKMTGKKDRDEWQDLHQELASMQLPSPLWKIRSCTHKRAEESLLRNVLAPKHQINFYSIRFLEKVAAGSFGTVFRADLKGEVVAAKIYQRDQSNKRSNIKMFCREVAMLSRFKHKNVLHFVGACIEKSDNLVIVTEFVEQGSLYSLLHEQNKALDMAAKIKLAHGIALGMSYLHSLSPPIIHRDLNSHNVLIGNFDTPVIADFGESQFYKSNGAKRMRNLTIQPGNLRWMAPEIFLQSSGYTLKADVFSYSLVVWELLSGRVPFEHMEPAAVAAEMAYNKKRPSIPTSTPDAIRSLLESAWHTSETERPGFKDIVSLLEFSFKVCLDGKQPRTSSIKK